MDYKNNAYTMEMHKATGCGNRMAVLLVLIALGVPNLVCLLTQ